jgi:hypothetical protein
VLPLQLFDLPLTFLDSSGEIAMGGDYTVACDCGIPHSVNAYEAGDLRMCKCRRQFRIPLTLKTTEKVIESMIKMHRLPCNDLCSFSGDRGDAIISIVIEQAPPSNKDIVRIAAILMTGLIGYFITAFATGPDEEEQEAIAGPLAIVPIRVSTRVIDQLSAAPQNALRNALSTTPVYAHLLVEHPNVSFSILGD